MAVSPLLIIIIIDPKNIIRSPEFHTPWTLASSQFWKERRGIICPNISSFFKVAFLRFHSLLPHRHTPFWNTASSTRTPTEVGRKAWDCEVVACVQFPRNSKFHDPPFLHDMAFNFLQTTCQPGIDNHLINISPFVVLCLTQSANAANKHENLQKNMRTIKPFCFRHSLCWCS